MGVKVSSSASSVHLFDKVYFGYVLYAFGWALRSFMMFILEKRGFIFIFFLNKMGDT